MRWAFQLFGKYYNPFDPQLELDMFKVLKKAYEHKDCDQKTVDLYFNEILERLYWGAHHFPDGCIITREAYEKTIKTAEMILAEKQVPQKSMEIYIYTIVNFINVFMSMKKVDVKRIFINCVRRRG